MIDNEKLLAEISPDAPTGADVEYDSDFIALEIAARGKPEQQVGTTVVPAEEPDWVDVRKRAETLFSRTKDLRVAVLLTRALIQSDGMQGLASGLWITKELMTRYWDRLYPLLEDDDPIARLNALAILADNDGVIRDVRNIYIVAPGKHGRVSVKDVLMVQGKFPAAGNVLSQQELAGIISRANQNAEVPLESIATALRSVKELRVFLNEKVGADRAPDLKQLEDMLKTVMQVCETVIGPSETIADLTSESDTETTENKGQLKSMNEIRSREDALQVLSRVCEFLERTEPANPAPLFIRRAQQLMKKNFAEIIQELVPDSWSQIQKMTGTDKK